MTAINDRLKIVYLFEHRTASRATVEALKRCVPDTRFTEAHHGFAPEGYDDYTVACTCRNPFATLVSKYYHFGQYQHMDFNIFVRRAIGSKHGRPGRGFWVDASWFCRFEDLENQLSFLFKTPVTLKLNPKHQSPLTMPWQQYYKKHMVEALMAQPEWRNYVERFAYECPPCQE